MKSSGDLRVLPFRVDDEIAGFCVTPPPPSQNRIFKASKRICGDREVPYIRKSPEAKLYLEELRWRLSCIRFVRSERVCLGALWASNRVAMPDVDNPMKLLSDALQGVYYENDRQVGGSVVIGERFVKDAGSEWNRAACILIAPFSVFPKVSSLVWAMAERGGTDTFLGTVEHVCGAKNGRMEG